MDKIHFQSDSHILQVARVFFTLFILANVLVLGSGCSLFEYIQRKATQGNINGDDWYVQKIVIDNKETFYAPQVLAANAKQNLAKQEQDDLPQKALKAKETTEALNNLSQAQLDAMALIYDKSRLNEIAQIDEVATLNFDTTQGRISGQSGCGSYFSSYIWSDKEHIELSNGGSTRKLCSPSEIVRFEFRFIRELEGSFKVVQKSRDYLVLEGKEMTIYLYRNTSS
ncbi:META domain-containing protein [Helicobacter sp.]|uniref:META domain-containing protein n=1 Tax=Helicobacter sp. TaxID=218 RepID=UPI0025C479BC|nr:META domain-containing protein [Helicobacter sp.]MBR2495505.1 META domain-containing protein [Helicobacter sp.]